MALPDRIYIKYANRELIDEWKKNEVLMFHDYESKDLFLFLAALGLETPKKIEGKKDGLVRLEYLRETDKAFFASKLLAKRNDNEEIDDYCDLGVAIAEMEMCAESGFEIFKNKVDKSNGDNDLLNKRLFNELDLLYEQNVKGNYTK